VSSQEVTTTLFLGSLNCQNWIHLFRTFIFLLKVVAVAGTWNCIAFILALLLVCSKFHKIDATVYSYD